MDLSRRRLTGHQLSERHLWVTDKVANKVDFRATETSRAQGVNLMVAEHRLRIRMVLLPGMVSLVKLVNVANPEAHPTATDHPLKMVRPLATKVTRDNNPRQAMDHQTGSLRAPVNLV